VVVVVEEFATVSRPPDGAESGLALTGELTSSAQDLPDAGWNVFAVAFIPEIFVVESSGFVTRSARELLVVAVGGVCSFGDDISQIESELSDQMVSSQSKVQLSQYSEEGCSWLSKTKGLRVKLIVFESMWVLVAAERLERDARYWREVDIGRFVSVQE
jgi:hypothetical protein